MNNQEKPNSKPEKTTIYAEILNSTPLGPIGIASSNTGITAVDFIRNLGEFHRNLMNQGLSLPDMYTQKNSNPANIHLSTAVEELSDYFSGSRKEFTCALDYSFMTIFQKQVLEITFAIPYGKVLTYGEIARKLGRPGAARAVGRAEATNPMPLLIPCHRVIGTDGKLHGYGGRGGINTKAWLLQFEGYK
jgi:methylated-DNA-[protein]-cysteine S-methyltransferase